MHCRSLVSVNEAESNAIFSYQIPKRFTISPDSFPEVRGYQNFSGRRGLPGVRRGPIRRWIRDSEQNFSWKRGKKYNLQKPSLKKRERFQGKHKRNNRREIFVNFRKFFCSNFCAFGCIISKLELDSCFNCDFFIIDVPSRRRKSASPHQPRRRRDGAVRRQSQTFRCWQRRSRITAEVCSCRRFVRGRIPLILKR